ISGGVYAALRGAAGLAGRAADVALESRSAPPDRALSTTPRGAAALAAINGLIGDELERQGSELHQPMAVRIRGRGVAPALEAVVAAWPVEIETIALIGHSMGGLVARSACYRASEDGAAWVRHVRHVVSLGTPHMGAPLEQAVHVAAAALSAVPETRPFGAFLRRRSSGIRDLRQGSLVDEDWQG